MCAGWQEAGGCQEAGGQEAGGQEDGDSGPECPLSSCAAQSPGDREAEAVSTDEYIAIGTKVGRDKSRKIFECVHRAPNINAWFTDE